MPSGEKRLSFLTSSRRGLASYFFTNQRYPIGLPRCNGLKKWDFFPLAWTVLCSTSGTSICLVEWEHEVTKWSESAVWPRGGPRRSGRERQRHNALRRLGEPSSRTANHLCE